MQLYSQYQRDKNQQVFSRKSTRRRTSTKRSGKAQTGRAKAQSFSARCVWSGPYKQSDKSVGAIAGGISTGTPQGAIAGFTTRFCWCVHIDEPVPEYWGEPNRLAVTRTTTNRLTWHGWGLRSNTGPSGVWDVLTSSRSTGKTRFDG
jgi:hypothetical protein